MCHYIVYLLFFVEHKTALDTNINVLVKRRKIIETPKSIKGVDRAEHTDVGRILFVCLFGCF